MAEAWTTVTTTEPEWDDDTRLLSAGLDQHDREVHACGLHSSILADPDSNRFVFEEPHCPMCEAITVRQRRLAEADAAWSKENPAAPAKTVRPSDGRSLTLRPMTPTEIQQAEAKRMEVDRGRSPRKRQR